MHEGPNAEEAPNSEVSTPDAGIPEAVGDAGESDSVVPEVTVEQQSETLPDFIHMYEVSGQDPITPHSFDRYNRDREQESAILERARAGAPFWRKKIMMAPEAERGNVIREGFATDDPAVHKACSALIWAAPEGEREGLRKELSGMIKNGFEAGDIDAQKEYAWTVWDAAKEDRTEIIQRGMTSEVDTVSESITRMIEHAPEADRSELIRSGLTSPDSALWATAARQIWSAPESERPELAQEVAERIEQGLSSQDAFEIKAAAKMIAHAPENERERFREQLAEILRETFTGDDLTRGKTLASLIAETPETGRGDLFELAQQQLGDRMAEHPLYRGTSINAEDFSRTDFDKTGSETILLGGETKDKAIVRRIQPESFLVWQRMYEDHDLWENAGFDYVPVEPIAAFRLKKDGFVDAYSGLLDLSLEEWEGMGGAYVDELRGERDKIRQILDKSGITNGHYHNANFCLRFERDEQGHVDYHKRPRIYVIDFDQALLPQAAFEES